MAMRRDDLTPNEQIRQDKLEASYAALQQRLGDSQYMVRIREQIARLDARPPAPRLTREEFLDQIAVTE